MTTNLIVLAILMFAVTYPSRALGLLTPGLDRLHRVAIDYLQIVGPAVADRAGSGRRDGRGERRR